MLQVYDTYFHEIYKPILLLAARPETSPIFVIYDSNDAANQITFTTIYNLYDYQIIKSVKFYYPKRD